MTWITTATGSEVSLRDPEPSAITLRTIAHHLSLINRFTGATCRPYSVAEHSLLVCEIAEREFHLDVHGQFAALMHDAHEAFTNDISTPAKDELGVPWAAFEYRFERLVRTAFAIHVPSAAHARELKQADLIALATERAQLLPNGGTPWALLDGVRPAGWVDLMSAERVTTTWSGWRAAFTARADALDFQRQQRARVLGR
ncbi:hypothetical protein [Rhizobacter sp. SG703]|uniref:hypothetical protein n=1 Tax=Rhizobacter sp. SG703 TaxID=2587140 RepID=UPI001444F84A|nr:hypothetical protein [Rhizobacter sp. SG703]NKI97562.1 hypothetical protein [Rhizobacter sp. SG703]